MNGVKLFSGQLTFESLSSPAASSAYFLPSTNLSDLPTAHSLGLGAQSELRRKTEVFTDYLPATLKRNGSLHPPEGDDGREGGAAVGRPDLR